MVAFQFRNTGTAICKYTVVSFTALEKPSKRHRKVRNNFFHVLEAENIIGSKPVDKVHFGLVHNVVHIKHVLARHVFNKSTNAKFCTATFGIFPRIGVFNFVPAYLLFTSVVSNVRLSSRFQV